MKPDLLSRRFWRRHQSADGFKQGADVLVVSFDFSLQFIEFGGQIPCEKKAFRPGARRPA